MAKTVFALLALVAVSFRYHGVFFARGFTLESGGYKAGTFSDGQKDDKRMHKSACTARIFIRHKTLCFTVSTNFILEKIILAFACLIVILLCLCFVCAAFKDFFHFMHSDRQ